MKISTNWRKEIQTIPNLLSIFRILLLPIYLYFVLRQSFYVAGVVIVVSGLSDYLDGVIARRYNQVTDLGKVLDPFADVYKRQLCWWPRNNVGFSRSNRSWESCFTNLSK